MVLYIILCKLISKFKSKEASSSKGGLLLAEAREALRIDVNKTRCKCELSTEVESVSAVTAGGSVKFSPAV